MLDVRTLFLALTEYTIPYGKESMIEPFLPAGFERDTYGNYHLKIGNPKIIFSAHADTVANAVVKVNHVFDGIYIKTDLTTILGADDKAGVVVLLAMIEAGVEGHYIIFAGEERGMVGAQHFIMANYEYIKANIQKVVSFDRKGYDSIITHQMGINGVSYDYGYQLVESFANNQIPMQLDETGLFTDSFAFLDIVPEFTNISVGYFNQHTKREYQDIEFLIRLCTVAPKIKW